MGIPASELTALQAAAAGLLDTTADIQRNGSSTIDIGQPTEAFASILPGGIPVAAGLTAPTQAMLLQYADAIANQQAWVVKFKYGQDVKPKDRIVINSLTLEVQAVLSTRSYPTLTRVLASKIG